jgi:hypothetical protein
MAVMAAIVATLCFPVAAGLALLACALLDLPIHALVTFGETFNAFAGLSLWWAIGLVPAFGYAAFASS